MKEMESLPVKDVWDKVKNSVERAFATDPLCEEVLKLLSFINMKNIPSELVVSFVEEIKGEQVWSRDFHQFIVLLQRILKGHFTGDN